MPANQIARRIISDLQRDLGLTQAQAAGVAGNLAHESDGFTAVRQYGGGPGRGWAQWEGERARDFERYISDNNLDMDSYEANYGFLLHEIENNPYERRQFERIRQADTPSEAARMFATHYERPGKPQMASRINYAESFAQDETPQVTPNFRGFEGMSIFDALQAYTPDRNPIDTARELFPGEIPAWAPANRVEQELRNRTLGDQELTLAQQSRIVQEISPPSPPPRPANLRRVRPSEVLDVVPEAYGYGQTRFPQVPSPPPRPSQAELGERISRDLTMLAGRAGGGQATAAVSSPAVPAPPPPFDFSAPPNAGPNMATLADATSQQPPWLASLYGGTAPTSQPAPLPALDPTYQLQNYPVAGLPPRQLLPQRQQRPPQQDPVRTLREFQETSGGGRGAGSEGGGRTTAQSMTNAYKSLQKAKELGLI